LYIGICIFTKFESPYGEKGFSRYFHTCVCVAFVYTCEISYEEKGLSCHPKFQNFISALLETNHYSKVLFSKSFFVVEGGFVVFSVLQCVAACCDVLQRVAMCCSVLQCFAERCSVLQCVAV